MGDFPHLPPPPSPPSAYPVSLLRRPYSSAASQLQRGEENESNMRTLSFSLTPAPAFFACFCCPVTLYNKHKGRTYQDTHEGKSHGGRGECRRRPCPLDTRYCRHALCYLLDHTSLRTTAVGYVCKQKRNEVGPRRILDHGTIRGTASNSGNPRRPSLATQSPTT